MCRISAALAFTIVLGAKARNGCGCVFVVWFAYRQVSVDANNEHHPGGVREARPPCNERTGESGDVAFPGRCSRVRLELLDEEHRVGGTSRRAHRYSWIR
jgi:hypothetical protein